jgi:hypothetical protein
MAEDSEGCLAGRASDALNSGLHPGQRKCKGSDMTKTGLSEDRANRVSAIERIRSKENHALIEEGIEAYKRDLPRLLEERKQHQMVAYRGHEQVALAPTYRKLRRQLERKKLTDESELFMIHIAPLEEEQQGRGA